MPLLTRRRSLAFPIFSGADPQAQTLIDTELRRSVRYVETIVPTVYPGSTATGVPAESIYQLAALSGVLTPSGTTSTGWDSTNKRSYRRLGDGVNSGTWDGSSPELWYTGWPGNQDYAPKNATASKLVLEFTARFNNNVDYATRGIGLADSGGTDFSSTAVHFIQILRNAGSWELGSCDGATISQTAGGTGDGNWHKFKLVWEAGLLTLYVDGVSTITKTTNLPDNALKFLATSPAASTIDIVDAKISFLE